MASRMRRPAEAPSSVDVIACIPILGTLISGAACVLLALTQGWPIALGVLAYFVGTHALEDDRGLYGSDASAQSVDRAVL